MSCLFVQQATIWPGAGPSSVSGTPKGGTQPSRAPAESAAVIAFHRENAALESAKKLLTAPKKYEKAAEDDGGGQVRAAAEAAANQKEKGKGKDLDASGSSETC